MAFTGQSELYAAVHEEGINAAIGHLRRQRPSLLAYGTALLQAKPGLLCKPEQAAPGVTQFVTVQPPLPIFGTGSEALNYAVQLTELQVEFHPGNVITLPAELNPPLAAQRFAFRARVCGGLGCPDADVDRTLPDLTLVIPGLAHLLGAEARPRAASLSRARMAPVTAVADGGSALSRAGLLRRVRDLSDIVGERPDRVVLPDLGPTVLPVQGLTCFCLDLLAAGGGAISGAIGQQEIALRLDGLELVNLEPVGLENALECYMLLVLNRGILPAVNETLSNLLFSTITFGSLGSLTLTGASVPNNPAIEGNELKAFADVAAFTLNVPTITIGTGEDGDGGAPEPTFTMTQRARTRSGAAHLTAAIAERGFRDLFNAIRDHSTFHIAMPARTLVDSAIGKVNAGADIRFHLAQGAVEFHDDNRVQIKELDIKWDKLQVTINVDLPKLCTPKICLFGVCTPQACFFESEADIPMTMNLPTAFTTEVSINLRPKVAYGISTSPLSSDIWVVKLDPLGSIDLDIIDVSDTVGDLLDTMISSAVDALGLPSVVEDIAGSVADIIRGLLDIGDDVGEWLTEFIFDTLGVGVGVEELLLKLFADEIEITRLDNPIEVMPAEGALIPVAIPIDYVGARVNDDELILEIDLGA